MALTIQQQPTANTYYPVGNPIELLVTTTNSGLANFKVEVKIYYDPAGANTLLATLRYDIIPTTTQVLIDAAPILQSKVVEDITNLRTSVTGLKNETTRLMTANVKVQEYFGAIPQASGTQTTSNTILYYNGSLKKLDWIDNKHVPYRIDSASAGDSYTGRILTGWDNYADVPHSTVIADGGSYFGGQFHVRKINYNQLAQLMFLWQGTSGTNKKVSLQYYNSAYATTVAGTISLASAQSPTSLNFGTAAIIAGGGGTLGSLGATSKYLSLAVTNNTFQLTAVYLYEIDWTPCGRFDSYEIHWLNRHGGWDSWVFDKRPYHQTDIERRSYNPTSIPISGSSIVHNSFDVMGKNFVVGTKEKYRVNSDYLRAWQLTGLEDLITSPLVYWNSPDYGFVNIVISEPDSHIHKLNTVDKLFNVGFTFEIDNQDVRQLP